MPNLRKLQLGVATSLLLSLAACGGGGGNGSNSASSGMIESGQASADSFFDQVYALVVARSETDDPVPVASFTPTTPENAEPKAF